MHSYSDPTSSEVIVAGGVKRKASCEDSPDRRPVKQTDIDKASLLTPAESFLHQNEDIVYFLKSDLLSLKKHNVNNQQTGFVGEEIGFLYLRARHAESCNISVDWINAATERGLPYDVEIYDNNTKETFQYVEIKSTTSNNRDRFKLTVNELALARKKGTKFTVLRISGIDLADKNQDLICVNILTLNDPFKLQEQEILKLSKQVILFPLENNNQPINT